nr:MAG TPA: hypothetical protein [Crassvirales sp.]
MRACACYYIYIYKLRRKSSVAKLEALVLH